LEVVPVPDASRWQWTAAEVIVFDDVVRWTHVTSSVVEYENICKSQRTVMTS
jgi:hypothetical protein